MTFNRPSSYQWKTFGHARQLFDDLGIECSPVMEGECRAIDDFLIANGS
jgi:hypothetical protein